MKRGTTTSSHAYLCFFGEMEKVKPACLTTIREEQLTEQHAGPRVFGMGRGRGGVPRKLRAAIIYSFIDPICPHQLCCSS